MAAPEFSAAYLFQTMPTGSRAQAADVSTPLSPHAREFSQHGTWQPHHSETLYSPSYTHFHDALVWTAPHHLNIQPYRDPHSAHAPAPSPYTTYGAPPPMYFPPAAFQYASHQPRLPPAIRSGTVESLLDSSRPSLGEQSIRNEPSAPRDVRPPWPPHNTGYQNMLNSAYSPYSMASQSANMPERPHVEPTNAMQPEPALRNDAIEQPRQTLPPPPSNHNANTLGRRLGDFAHSNASLNDGAERESTNIPAAQLHHSSRNLSPRTSARRSFDRYSGDVPPSNTSSDAEEAAARSPPSSRVRHRPREGRQRWFNQYLDPSYSTARQIQELKAGLAKLCVNELPNDTSPACDVCAKDYSASPVQPTEDNEVAVQLPCGHIFGEFCIGEWFDTCKTHKNKVTCPMCRKVLVELPPPQYRSSYLHMYAARNPRSFQELMAHELHAQYAQA